LSTLFSALGLDTHRDAVKAVVREAELELIQTHGYGRRPMSSR